MKSLTYILFTVIITLLIALGWQGGAHGHGYMHLGFLVLGGFLGGIVYKEVRKDIREENGQAEHAENHYNGTRYI
jgi:hypothetical protein